MRHLTAWISAIAVASSVGCVSAPNDGNDELIDDFDETKDDGGAATRALKCTNSAGSQLTLRFTRANDLFMLELLGPDRAVVWAQSDLRPSLNVAIAQQREQIAEFIDFRPAGLTTVAALAEQRIELALGGDKQLTLEGMDQSRVLCSFVPSRLLAFLAVAPKTTTKTRGVTAVGFDIDDTLLFSTPAFARGLATGGAPGPRNATFWRQVNSCDPGCAASTITIGGVRKDLPATSASPVKSRVRELVEQHRALGHKIYVITARPAVATEPLRNYLLDQLGIAPDAVFFEPDLDQPGNPAGKADRMEALQLDVFYGDSDSDITDAQSVTSRTITPIRILRSPASSNRKDGRLNKYHPGYFGERIIANSYE